MLDQILHREERRFDLHPRAEEVDEEVGDAEARAVPVVRRVAATRKRAGVSEDEKSVSCGMESPRTSQKCCEILFFRRRKVG
eukprot:COSAG06_NODE_32418_length_506_cov_1.132678_2_plen_82_part_00